MEAKIALETAIEIFEPMSLRIAEGFKFEHVPMFLEFGPNRLDVVYQP